MKRQVLYEAKNFPNYKAIKFTNLLGLDIMDLEVTMELHKLVRLKREKAGMTQAELAERMGLCLRTYNRLENGGREFSVSEAFFLAELLKISTREIKQIHSRSRV